MLTTEQQAGLDLFLLPHLVGLWYGKEIEEKITVASLKVAHALLSHILNESLLRQPTQKNLSAKPGSEALPKQWWLHHSPAGKAPTCQSKDRLQFHQSAGGLKDSQSSIQPMRSSAIRILEGLHVKGPALQRLFCHLQKIPVNRPILKLRRHGSHCTMTPLHQETGKPLGLQAGHCGPRLNCTLMLSVTACLAVVLQTI